jgi:hypothetical protein
MTSSKPVERMEDVLTMRIGEAKATAAEGAAAACEIGCVRCGNPIGSDGQWHSGDVGGLYPYCADCARIEFVVP